MHSIFVSYAKADVHFVEAVLAHAEVPSRGLKFFRASDPDSLPPGTKWRERLLSEMDRADLAVFFVSQRSIDRPWLNFELGYIEKSVGMSVICVTIDNPDIAANSSPVIAHHLLPLSTVPKLAAEELLRFVRSYLPARKAGSVRFGIHIASKIRPLDRGWQRYMHSATNKTEIQSTPFGFAFGKTFDDDAFRYPASRDSLLAPWKFLLVNANPNIPVNVYFIMEMTDGSMLKLYVNSNQEAVGFGIPADEFMIPVPKARRPSVLLVDIRSFLPRIGKEPRAVKGLRVRGPTELANLGMFDSLESIPPRLRRGAFDIALP